jgi:hypothetical protein
MHPNAQILLDQLPTPATALAGVAWVNQYDTTASLFRFAYRDQYKLFPRRICNAFRKAVVFEHSLCVQVLKGQYAEVVDQFPAFLMGKVRAPVHYPLMHTADNLTALRSVGCAFLGFREFALHFRQFMFLGAEKARISDLLPIRQGSERSKANIHANCATIWCKWLCRCFHAQAGIPFTCSRAPNRDRLDFSLNRSMQDDFHRPNLTHKKRVPFQSHTIAILRVGDTIIAAKALVSRVAAFLFACLDTTKKRLECQIDTDLNILQDLAMHQFERWTIGFPGRKEGLRIVQSKRLLTLLPRFAAGSKCLVIDKAAFLKHRIEDTLLSLCWTDSVFVRFTHTGILALSSVNSNVCCTDCERKPLKRRASFQR